MGVSLNYRLESNQEEIGRSAPAEALFEKERPELEQLVVPPLLLPGKGEHLQMVAGYGAFSAAWPSVGASQGVASRHFAHCPPTRWTTDMASKVNLPGRN